MSKVFEEIAKEATQLSREQRLDLASLLLELDDDSEGELAVAAWSKKFSARLQAVEDGTPQSETYEDVMRDAEGRLTS